jgi:cobalt-zinc-cadmium efflux system outer membrane protein
MTRILFYYFILFTSSFIFSQATNSKSFTIDDLERQFLEKNYQLLAAKYNIEKADAEIVQSKLWKNPNLTISQINFWHNNTAPQQANLLGNYGKFQQFAFDVEQVIETAGKRKKRVALKTTEKNTVLLDFESLIRELKFKLRASYYDLYQIHQIKTQLNILTNYYTDLTDAFGKQVENQNLAKADLYRVKTALLNAQQQAIEWESKELDAIQNLRVLTQQPDLTLDQLIFTDKLNINLSQKIPDNIYDLAKDSSLTKQYAEQQLIYSEQLLKLEKANASPDVSVLVNYDRNGNYMRDFIGFGIGIDLPIYNRNQGNIKLAKAQVEQQKMQLNAVNIELETSISKLTKQLKAYENLLNQFPSTAMQEFQSMMENYVKHLKSKQVSLFEFIDFADSFLQSQSKYYEIEKNYFETFEQIQYLIGKDL